MVLKKAQGKDWKKVGRWNAPTLLNYLIQEANMKDVHEFMGFDLYFKDMLCLCSTYFTHQGYDDFKLYFEEKLKKYGFGYFREYSNLIYTVGNNAIAFSEQIKSLDVSKLTKSELFYYFNMLLHHHKLGIALGYSIQPCDEVLTGPVLEKLKKYTQKADQIFSKLTVPKKESYIARENIDLHKIADKINKNEKQKTALINRSIHELDVDILYDIKNHIQSYQWMKSVDWRGEFFPAKYYYGRLKEIVENPETIQSVLNSSEDTENEILKLVKEISKKVPIAEDIDIIRDMINTKMFNWDAISLSGNNCRNLMTYIGSRNGFTYEETLFLIPDEIRSIISGETIELEVVQQRMKGEGYVKLDDEITELNQDQIQILSSHLKQDIPIINEVSGKPAFPGNVTGPAVIVPIADELDKVKRGDILICPMTDPNYLPAISKCAGIVTDEGGVLCHAAIVSREYKKPCVTSTKIATQAFSDGDIVMVDANNGKVKKK